MVTAVRRLDGSGGDVAVVGGKAAALDRLIGIDLPVPPAAVLDTAAYRDVAAQPAVAAAIERVRRASSPGEAERRAVDEAFLAAALPDGTAEELRRIAWTLCPGGEPLAVRSSATAEDTATISFAGQYRSFLAVRTDAELERAVRLVWAALWHPAPVGYRRYWGVPDRDVAMAVLLMRQVDAVAAGVAFTVDPTSGRELVRVEWVPGTAEGLVGGALTPTVRLVPRGGPVPVDVDVPLGELRRLVLQVEAAFGAPQDVEWAFDGQRVLLVQARPMTAAAGEPAAGDGFDVRPSRPAELVTAGIAEMLPGPLPPLVWQTSGFLVEEALREMLGGLGTLPHPLPTAHELLARVGGRARLNLDLLRQVAEATPGASVAELERQYFGATAVAASPPAAPARRWSAVRRDLRAARVRQGAVREGMIAAEAAREVVAAGTPHAELSDRDLLGYRGRLVHLGARATAAEVAVAAAAVTAYERLRARLGTYLDPQDAHGAAQLLTGGVEEDGSLAGPVWQRLCAAAAGAEVAAVLSAGIDWERASRELTARPAGRRFLAELDSAAREAGSMAVFAGPGWQEDPALAWQAVLGAWRRRGMPADTGAADRRRALLTRLAGSPRWRRERMVGAMLVDLPGRLLDHQVRDARRLLGQREQLKAVILQVGGEVRRVHVELGARLARRGRLLQAEDVHYLSAAELAAAVAGGGPGPGAVALRRRRLAEIDRQPGSEPGRPSPGTPRGNRLVGWPASAGRRTGPGRVVDRPDDAEFRPGDVLVARSTDPSWLPLFLRAGAIVVEEGGTLSHAAIVARELGLPAVLNVPGVVDRVRGRDVEVTVDGTAGTVTVRTRSPAPAERPAGAPGRPPSRSPRPPEPEEALARSVPARPPLDLDGPGVDEVAIFVPAILAGGLLYSLVVLLRDVLHRALGQRLARRRGVLFGHQTAAVVLGRGGATMRDTAGLRPRRVHAAVGLGFAGLAAYGLPGSTWNYLNPAAENVGIAWMLAWSLLAVIAFAAVGAVNLAVAWRYRAVPAWTLPLLFNTPLGQVTGTAGGADPGAPAKQLEPEDPGRWPGRRAARRLRLVAWLWGAAAIGAFLVLADVEGVPRSPEGGIMGRSIEEPLQLGLLGLLAVGLLIAWRLEAVGLATMATAAAGLGFLASVQYPSSIALLVAAVLTAPAALLWLAHQHSRSLHPLLALGAVTVLLLVAVWTGGSRVYAHYFGPAHPSSSLSAQPVDQVEWTWAGALTADSFTVTARLADTSGGARLAVSTDPALTGARYTPAVGAPAEEDPVVRFAVRGLAPDTRYHYAVEVDGRLDRVARGVIRTAPGGPSSFTFAVSGCSRTGSNGAVFDAIRAADPLFFLSTGDFFYANIGVDDVGRFRGQYDANLTAPAQAALYRSTAIAYMWDDHDYGPNDADSTSPSRPAALEAYRRYVPHHPLASRPDGPINQAFTIGRVRFLLTDTRSARVPASAPGDPTMLGAAQLAWLERELLAARDRYALIVWVNPNPWIAPGTSSSDGWAGFAAERRRIATFIDEARITNLLMLAGDGHMLAIDDGSNNRYAASGTSGFPVFQAAPLDRPASVKGGPYSEGTSTEGGQFGLVTVDDRGSGPVQVTLSGRTYTGAEVLRYRFTARSGS